MPKKMVFPIFRVEYPKYYPFSSLKLCSMDKYPGDIGISG
jgi:hypothetical protein